MARNRETILKTLEANRTELQHLGVRRLRLFGSAARGEATETSDLDCLVEFNHKSFDACMGLKEFLEDLFACRIDLVLRDSLKPRLRQSVLDETIHATGL